MKSKFLFLLWPVIFAVIALFLAPAIWPASNPLVVAAVIFVLVLIADRATSRPKSGNRQDETA